ncbi:nucleotidyltransferase domain-containing protein [bacterium]|nr:nucleotidyltransferase domain-containing protein [bacterium]
MNETYMTREVALDYATRILRERYPGAQLAFAAGSIIRGEGTSTSDLDLVVIFDKLSQAYRESFLFEGLPVEAFVHDPETLAYFCWQMDRKEGIPSLPTMLADGVALPASSQLAEELVLMGKKVLEAGPEPMSTEEISRRRYHLGELLDDLRAPRSKVEMMAIGTALYGPLADFALRQRGVYSATGKWIPRRLQATDEQLHDRFHQAFEQLFRESASAEVIALVEDVLAPVDGPLFEDYRLDAPKEWRQKVFEV